MDGEETQQLQGQVAGDRVPASVGALVDSWQMLPINVMTQLAAPSP